MTSAADVIDRAERSRFELAAAGGTAIAAYTRRGDAIVFTHTEVPAALGGRGVGTMLIAGALAIVRADGRRIVPACSFVRAYVDAHPEVRDLLA